MPGIIDEMKRMTDAIAVVDGQKRTDLLILLSKLAQQISVNIAGLGDGLERFEKQLLPAINAQLAAADKRTEIAADKLMGSTEKISAILKTVPAAEKDAIQKELNAIFETCSFQDLVSQHLNEVRLRLGDLEKETVLIRDTINSLGSSAESAAMRRRREEQRSDAHLLNGPSTEVI